MNKKIFILSFVSLIFCTSTSARISVQPIWTQDREKAVQISCDKEDPYICDDICDSKTQCIVKEGICKNCIGNSLFITNFYKNIGSLIINSGEFLDRDEIVPILSEGNFVTLEANSIYNTLTEFDSKQMRAQFAKLCPWTTKSGPTVFARVHPVTREPDGYHYVFCDSTPYILTDKPALYERSSEESLEVLLY